MKIRCVKNNLEKIIQQAQNFIGKNLDLEVLSCIILDAKDGYLKIESTNIDTSFYCEIPVILEKEGRVAVLGETFFRIISAIKDEEVVLDLKGNILKIESKNSKVELNTISNEDFPNVLKKVEKDSSDFVKKFNIKIKDFINGLESTMYAASKSNIKPELSSVFISLSKKDIFFTATDGFRLAEKKEKYTSEEEGEACFLLPGDCIFPIIKTISLENESSEIEVYIFNSQIFIQTEKFTIFSRLTDGNYIDYKKIIPEEKQTSVIVLKQDLIDSLKLINIFSNEFNQIKIIIKNKKFILDTNNKFGKNQMSIDAAISGQDLDMNFNYKYIQEVFSSIKTDSLEFIFNEGKPLLLKSVGDNSFKYVIMPLSR